MTDEASKRAEKLPSAGMRLSDAGDGDAAIASYRQALVLHRVGFAAQGKASITAVLNSWQDRRRRVADFRCTLDARLS